ncbi:TPA: 30S ribosomal protein S9 [Candidatus Dependentiae bacterium]|nr:30S ribosomal protein S9 [Candidatus Dependentiae bacterium]
MSATRTTKTTATKSVRKPAEATKSAPKKAVVKKEAGEAVVKAPKVAKPTVKKPDVLAQGTGRRKASVARVFLRQGKGVITVNGRPFDLYFDTDIARRAVKFVHNTVAAASEYDVDVNVCGGGIHGQADAVKLGISRALLEINPELRSELRSHGLLTVDARVKERKKFGRKAARRRFQFVKR